jgi:hypothetical protein
MKFSSFAVLVILGSVVLGPLVAQANPKFEADVPSATNLIFTQDFAFLQNIQGDGNASSLHRSFFGAVQGDAYQRYFDARISTIGVNECGGGGGAILCMIPSFSNNTLFLNPTYFPGMDPRIARLGTYLSIAKHAESDHNNWPYEICPTPFNDPQGNIIKSIWRKGVSLANTPNCEMTETGPVGVMAVFLKNISKHCANCSTEDRNYANWLADQMSYRVIDHDAYGRLLRDFAE